MAGDARNDAGQRRREGAERLARAGGVAHRGDAERATARALTGLPPDWTVFHDVPWPGRRGARIDHVVVGSGGVFVVSSESWSGEVSVTDGVLSEDGHPRERAVASVAEAALQVGQMSTRLSVTQPVLCVSGSQPVSDMAREVVLCTPDNVVEVLMAKKLVMGPAQVRAVAQELDAQFRTAAAALGPVVPRPRVAGDASRHRALAPDQRSRRRVTINAAPGRAPRAEHTHRRARRRSTLLRSLGLIGIAIAIMLLAQPVADLAFAFGDWVADLMVG